MLYFLKRYKAAVATSALEKYQVKVQTHIKLKSTFQSEHSIFPFTEIQVLVNYGCLSRYVVDVESIKFITCLHSPNNIIKYIIPASSINIYFNMKDSIIPTGDYHSRQPCSVSSVLDESYL